MIHFTFGSLFLEYNSRLILQFKTDTLAGGRYQANRERRQMHLDENSIHDLVGAIYDRVADPALWQDALVRLSDATRSIGAMFIAMDRVRPVRSRYVLGRLDPDLMHDFLARHAGDAPWAQAASRVPPGVTFSIDSLAPARDAERMVGLSVFRTPKIGPVEAEELRLSSVVAPQYPLMRYLVSSAAV